MTSEMWAMVVAGAVLGLLGGLALALRRKTTEPSEVGRIERLVELQSAEVRRLADEAGRRDLVSEQLRQGLDGTRRVLEEIRVREQERRSVDEEHREVVRRLATVLAGGTSKGRAGENVLREHLSELPPGMLSTDFRVNGKVVEFGLVLPDGRRLPIDSKWTALSELEALEAAEDPDVQAACARAVEKAVLARAREVAQYLDPAVTAPVAVAAVPDAVYAVLRRAHADAYAKGVVVVPYSSALPIVLFLYALMRRFGDAADVQASLAEMAGVLDALEAVVENKVAKAATMLVNGADEFRSHIGKARGSIARAHGASAPDSTPAGEAGEESALSIVS